VVQLKPLLLAGRKATRTPGALVLVDNPRLGRWVTALGSRNLAGDRLRLTATCASAALPRH
jgi:hypothetical protein